MKMIKLKYIILFLLCFLYYTATFAQAKRVKAYVRDSYNHYEYPDSANFKGRSLDIYDIKWDKKESMKIVREVLSESRREELKDVYIWFTLKLDLIENRLKYVRYFFGPKDKPFINYQRRVSEKRLTDDEMWEIEQRLKQQPFKTIVNRYIVYNSLATVYMHFGIWEL